VKRLWVVFLLLVSITLPSAAQAPAFDLVIEGGRIVDGTGNAGYDADLGLRESKIARIGHLAGAPRNRTINAKGLVVAPGFIDMLVGSSIPLLLDPKSASSKLHQGITTIVVGEGDSMAPQNEHTLTDFPASDQLPTWHTFEEYFVLLQRRGLAMNVLHNVGATQVRRIVIGDANQQPSADQLSRMGALVEESMRQGAVGLSSALIYPPGTYAQSPELIELAKAAAKHHGVYFSHIRNESKQLLPSIEEAIRIGREAHIPVHIYHLKVAGQENWRLFGAALKLIENARRDGIDITADIYPYLRNGIPLTSFLPPKYFADGTDSILDHLAEKSVREQVRQEVSSATEWENWYVHAGRDWNNVLIAEVPGSVDRSYVGRSIQEVSVLRHEDAWDSFFFLLRSGRGETNVDPLTMNEEQKEAALREPFICIASDSAPTDMQSVISAHPRTFGTFPRILARYVRQRRVLTLEAAIRAMTSLPANILRLHDRGQIAPGMAADIVIFNPQTIQDVATFQQPLAYPTGVDYVLVNGVIVLEIGREIPVRPGKILLHGHS